MPETTNISPAVKSEATANVQPAMAPVDAEPKRRAFWKRRSVWLIAALLLIGIAVCGYHWAFGKAKVHYTTAAVTRGDVESTVVAAGIVQPVQYGDVGAQTSGKLKSLKVIRGDPVKADQLIAEIDPALADTALTAANASLESMTAEHALKLAQLVLAQVQELRNDELYTNRLISTSDRDITKAAYDVAFADAASLGAQMKQAAAAIDTAKANLGYTKITAPMAGEVVSISLLEGQTLNANQSAPNILRIADIVTVTVWAQVFIVLAQAKGVLLIPAAAIGNAGEGANVKVRVLKADGTVESRTIKIGIKSELSAEVKDGLKEKELVIIGESTAQGSKTTSALSARCAS